MSVSALKRSSVPGSFKPTPANIANKQKPTKTKPNQTVQMYPNPSVPHTAQNSSENHRSDVDFCDEKIESTPDEEYISYTTALKECDAASQVNGEPSHTPYELVDEEEVQEDDDSIVDEEEVQEDDDSKPVRVKAENVDEVDSGMTEEPRVEMVLPKLERRELPPGYHVPSAFHSRQQMQHFYFQQQKLRWLQWQQWQQRMGYRGRQMHMTQSGRPVPPPQF